MPGVSFVDNYVMLQVCLHFENSLKHIHVSLIGIKYRAWLRYGKTVP